MAAPGGNPNTSSLLPRAPNPSGASPNPAQPPATPFRPASHFPAPSTSVPLFYTGEATPFPYTSRPPIHFPPGIVAAAGGAVPPSGSVPQLLSNPISNQNPGAHLMALLQSSNALQDADSAPSSAALSFYSSAEPIPSAVAPPEVLNAASPALSPSNKLPPRGRLLGGGKKVVYDVDSRMPGETQPPQLQATPITNYTSDPELVLGRQIAVSRTYICYGLKLGAIRVINITTALRSLLMGHSQRVTDMVFFAKHDNLLASASVDGRVYVWKIEEGPDEENNTQIAAKLVIAIQIIGDRESYHPRISWHSNKQEILFVGIADCVLRIDTNKLGRGKEFLAEDPLKCPLEKLIDGVQLIGRHNGDVTDLSISQWMTTRLATASKDGMVKIWADHKLVPLSSFRPHDGHPVNSVVFMKSPNQPDHIILITAGPLNREVKIWALASEKAWLVSSNSESWQCTQTLDLRSSLQPHVDEAFFNQIIVLAQSSLIVIANAKKNAIYAVHVYFGSRPAFTCMDCIADFTFAMPILSLTGTYSNRDGEQVVQLYCVQTQAVQQYALDLAQCLPPPTANAGSGKDFLSRIFSGSEGPALQEAYHGPTFSNFARNASALPEAYHRSTFSAHTDSTAAYASVNTNTLSSATDTTILYELFKADSEIKPSDPLPIADPNLMHAAPASVPLNLELPGRLPELRSPHRSSDIGSSYGDHESDQLQFDYSNDWRIDQLVTSEPEISCKTETTGKYGFRVGQLDVSALPSPLHMLKFGGSKTDLVTLANFKSAAVSSSDSNHGVMDKDVKFLDMIITNNNAENVEVELKVVDEGRSGHKNNFDSQRMPQGAASKGIVQDSENDVLEQATESFAAAPQSLPASKGKKAQEGKPFRPSVPATSSSSPFDSSDSLNDPGSSVHASLPEIRAMHETLNQLMAMQKEMQKQMGAIIASPILEKSVITKLEAAVARQVQAQFLNCAKQALQDTLRFCLEESSVVPAFKQSCKTMFNVFQKGMSEHLAAAQQQFEAAHTPLSISLRDTINSASSITQSLINELIDGQHKLLALVTAGNQSTLAPASVQQANGPNGGLPERALSIQQVEAPLDSTKELSRFISEQKYEEVFTMALQRGDVPIVSWLCTQVDLLAICSTVPIPLSQGVLLALLQQLACDINNDTARKVRWMTNVAMLINPIDPVIALHVRPIFEQVYNILGQQRSHPTTTSSEASMIRLIMHVINSLLMGCK